jgi:peptidoglycan hydrolase-like protein with peptidoglycan-binding domain
MKATPTSLPAAGHFSWETKAAVEALQSAVGISSPSGSLAARSVVFEPEAIRVTSVPGSLGNPAAGQVLSETSDRHVVSIALNATSDDSGWRWGIRRASSCRTGRRYWKSAGRRFAERAHAASLKSSRVPPSSTNCAATPGLHSGSSLLDRGSDNHLEISQTGPAGWLGSGRPGEEMPHG